jgi:hypothetical protein
MHLNRHTLYQRLGLRPVGTLRQEQEQNQSLTWVLGRQESPDERQRVSLHYQADSDR